MEFAKREEIAKLVERYAESINHADLDLAAELWATEDPVVFIHPKGDERGYAGVIEGFYIKLMKDKFSERTLTVYDLDISCYEGLAIAVFYWEFNATWREDGSPQHTEGRETQVFRHDGKKWALTHIHYSNMPVLGVKEGF